MGYGRSNYRRGYSSRPQATGRIAKPNARPGPCRDCGEEIPAGAGQLWRGGDGSWSVVHVEATQGGWLMHPQPYRGGCPESTDKRNAELHASGFLGPDAPAPASEREHLAAKAARYAESNPAPAPRQSYARTSRYERCAHEDYPCCGCGE
jgi:hypothetical protein